MSTANSLGYLNDYPIPLGSMMPFASELGAVPPTFLPCDGAPVLKSDYPNLYAVIGDDFVPVQTTGNMTITTGLEAFTITLVLSGNPYLYAGMLVSVDLNVYEVATFDTGLMAGTFTEPSLSTGNFPYTAVIDTTTSFSTPNMDLYPYITGGIVTAGPFLPSLTGISSTILIDQTNLPAFDNTYVNVATIVTVTDSNGRSPANIGPIVVYMEDTAGGAGSINHASTSQPAVSYAVSGFTAEYINGAQQPVTSTSITGSFDVGGVGLRYIIKALWSMPYIPQPFVPPLSAFADGRYNNDPFLSGFVI